MHKRLSWLRIAALVLWILRRLNESELFLPPKSLPTRRWQKSARKYPFLFFLSFFQKCFRMGKIIEEVKASEVKLGSKTPLLQKRSKAAFVCHLLVSKWWDAKRETQEFLLLLKRARENLPFFFLLCTSHSNVAFKRVKERYFKSRH